MANSQPTTQTRTDRAVAALNVAVGRVGGARAVLSSALELLDASRAMGEVTVPDIARERLGRLLLEVAAKTSADGSVSAVPDRATTVALHRLLVLLLAERAPGLEAVLTWSCRDRFEVRRWADRQLERYTIGPEGCPALKTPPVLGMSVFLNDMPAARAGAHPTP